MELVDGRWTIPDEETLIIDLGWYPEGKKYGSFKLVLAKVINKDPSWQILKEKKSTNRFEIRDTIEEWMQYLNKTIRL